MTAKECFKKMLGGFADAEIHHLIDNGIFIADIFVENCKKNSRLSHFVELMPIIKMLLLRCLFKTSGTGKRPLWLMFLNTGASMELIILNFVVLMQHILFGLTIIFHLPNCLIGLIIIVTYFAPMFWVLPSL